MLPMKPAYPPVKKQPATKQEPVFDLKEFRLVVSDFLLSPNLQNLFAKVTTSKGQAYSFGN